jgi:hypothetical protein
MVMTSLHCNFIHEGLDISFPKWGEPNLVEYRCCCIADKTAIRTTSITDTNFWNNEYFQFIRNLNKKNIWNNDCNRCRVAEEAEAWDDSHRLHCANLDSEPRTNLSGPANLTIKLSSVCNLMCTTCGPEFSTTWQNAVKKNPPIFLENPDKFYTDKRDGEAEIEKVIKFFDNIDVSNLDTINFTGGETLLPGNNSNVKFLEYIDNRHSLDNITVMMHTNGTKPIPENMLELLSKCKFVRLCISIDCIGDRFNYLRAPADWTQVEDNILGNLQYQLGKRAQPEDEGDFTLHCNQVISILSLYYMDEAKDWCNSYGFNYGDHTAGGEYSLSRLTNKYINALNNEQKIYLPNEYFPKEISRTIQYLDWYDNAQNLNWKKTFPEIAQFYLDYI